MSYSPTFREGEFSEGGLPLNNVLGNPHSLGPIAPGSTGAYHISYPRWQVASFPPRGLRFSCAFSWVHAAGGYLLSSGRARLVSNGLRAYL
jgi:hypothetical protein